jgi:hypothetical protein
MRYHNQCISPRNMLYGTTTSVLHLATVVPYDTLSGARHWSWFHMTHYQVRGTGRGTVWHILTHDQVGNVYKISTNSETIKVFDNIYALCRSEMQDYIWHYVIWYHVQCISHRNVSYGTTTSVFHLALCHMVPRPVYFTWKCVIRYHDQCSLAICHTVPQSVYFTLPGEIHWLWYRIAYCQVKYTGCGTAWHNARLHWSWYRIAHCQVKYTGCGTVWLVLDLWQFQIGIRKRHLGKGQVHI